MVVSCLLFRVRKVKTKAIKNEAKVQNMASFILVQVYKFFSRFHRKREQAEAEALLDSSSPLWSQPTATHGLETGKGRPSSSPGNAPSLPPRANCCSYWAKTKGHWRIRYWFPTLFGSDGQIYGEEGYEVDHLRLPRSWSSRRGWVSNSLKLFNGSLWLPFFLESGRAIAAANKKERILRVIVTDGSDIGLRGQVMYFIRPTNEMKLTIKNIDGETYFGVLDISDPEEPGIVLDSVVANLNTLLIPYLQNVPSWVTIAEPDLAESVRHKFLTSITHYSEFLSRKALPEPPRLRIWSNWFTFPDCKNDIMTRLDLSKIADMTELLEYRLSTPEKVMEAAKNAEVVAKVEHIVILWCKNIERVLALSKLMRKDTDAMGPNAELAYWRNLHAKMCFIIQQLQQWEFVHFIQVLIHSKSKVLRVRQFNVYQIFPSKWFNKH